MSDKIFNLLIGVFVTAIVARYFGPELYGSFNYALAFVALFTALSTLGLENLIIKSLIDKEYDEGTILCTSLILRIVGGSLLTLAAFTAIRFVETDDSDIHILVLFLSLAMVMRSFEVIEYWVQANLKSKITSLIRMIANIISASSKILIVVNQGSLSLLALVYCVDAAIIGAALLFTYRIIRSDKSVWRLSLRFAVNILMKSWYLILSGLMITLYMRIDQVMLGYMLPSKSELGIYSAASRIAEMWYFIPLSIITAFKPVIMSRKREDEASYLQTMQLLYVIITWISIGFGILILILSKPAITILYGADYIDAASVLLVSIWAGIFAMLGSARSIWLICEGLQRYTLYYASSGCLINVLLNLLLIPVLGATGAAVGTLIAQMTANVIVLAFFKETRNSSVMIIKSFAPTFIFDIKKKVQKVYSGRG